MQDMCGDVEQHVLSFINKEPSLALLQKKVNTIKIMQQ